MRGISQVDRERLRRGKTDRYTATAEQHIAHVTDTDGTTIRWSVEVFLRDDDHATQTANNDYERIARRMAKERGEPMPKASDGDLVHHYDLHTHYSHPYDPDEICALNNTNELCYAEKVHMLCAGADCEWLNKPDEFDYETDGVYDLRVKSKASINRVNEQSNIEAQLRQRTKDIANGRTDRLWKPEKK